MIKLTRLSDNKEFVIDGEDKEWRATLIEGIDALATNVYTETPAIGSGEIVTGKYIGRRDITVTAHRSSLIGISAARSIVMEFFNPDDTYTMEIQYNGRHLYIDGELLSYKLPTGNIYRPLDLTFTLLCPDPYFYVKSVFNYFNYKLFSVNGDIATAPEIEVECQNEVEHRIYVDNANEPIRIILPDEYQNQTRPFKTLQLNCNYGTLIDKTTGTNLTDSIISGNPIISFAPGEHHLRLLSKRRDTESGNATISSGYHADITTSQKITELELVINGSQVIRNTYEYTTDVITIPDPGKNYDYSLIFNSSGGFTLNGPLGLTFSYTAVVSDLSNNSKINLTFKNLYRGI